jgi:hypothetical protein
MLFVLLKLLVEIMYFISFILRPKIRTVQINCPHENLKFIPELLFMAYKFCVPIQHLYIILAPFFRACLKLTYIKSLLLIVLPHFRWEIEGLVTVAVEEEMRLSSFGCIKIYFIIFCFNFLTSGQYRPIQLRTFLIRNCFKTEIKANHIKILIFCVEVNTVHYHP